MHLIGDIKRNFNITAATTERAENGSKITVLTCLIEPDLLREILEGGFAYIGADRDYFNCGGNKEWAEVYGNMCAYAESLVKNYFKVAGIKKGGIACHDGIRIKCKDANYAAELQQAAKLVKITSKTSVVNIPGDAKFGEDDFEMHQVLLDYNDVYNFTETEKTIQQQPDETKIKTTVKRPDTHKVLVNILQQTGAKFYLVSDGFIAAKLPDNAPLVSLRTACRFAMIKPDITPERIWIKGNMAISLLVESGLKLEGGKHEEFMLRKSKGNCLAIYNHSHLIWRLYFFPYYYIMLLTCQGQYFLPLL